MIKLLSIALSVGVFANVAMAQTTTESRGFGDTPKTDESAKTCGSREEMVNFLYKKYNEVLILTASAQNGTRLEIFGNYATATWSQLVVFSLAAPRPELLGQACVVNAGNGYGYGMPMLMEPKNSEDVN